ncbi:4756_t:CDS:2, partial [Diversispora eburnea]
MAPHKVLRWFSKSKKIGKTEKSDPRKSIEVQWEEKCISNEQKNMDLENSINYLTEFNTVVEWRKHKSLPPPRRRQTKISGVDPRRFGIVEPFFAELDYADLSKEDWNFFINFLSLLDKGNLETDSFDEFETPATISVAKKETISNRRGSATSFYLDNKAERRKTAPMVLGTYKKKIELKIPKDINKVPKVPEVICNKKNDDINNFMKTTTNIQLLSDICPTCERQIMTWQKRLEILYGITIGLIGIHKYDITHKNLHSGNVLINFSETLLGDLRNTCKMYDINSKTIDDNDDYSKKEEILPFMAPEILCYKPYTKSSDIYSFGIIMRELAHLKSPFMNNVNLTIDDETMFEKKNVIIPEIYIKLMNKCLSQDPYERPSAEELYRTIGEWLSKVIFVSNSDLSQQFQEAEGWRLKRVKWEKEGEIHLKKLTSKLSLSDVPISKTRYKSLKDIIEYDNSINIKYCGTEDCKFLVAYYPFLQENKLCDNYIDYINLARLLNRVIVLTNVGPTRISTCQKFPFSFHYDVNSLSQRFPDVKFISQLEFQKWTELRYQKPTASHVFITNGGLNNSIEDMIPYPDTLKRIWCLDKFNLNFDKFSKFKQISTSKNNWKDVENNNDFISFLKSNLQFTQDVLLIRHDIRHPLFFVEKIEQLNYAKHIIDTAEMIINRLRPYVAVQWILEHADENNLIS